VDVYGLSLDSIEATRAYLQHHDIDFLTVSFTDRRLQALYRAGITPQTLIIDAEGKVSYARIGALTESVSIDSVLLGANGLLSEAAEGDVDRGTT
jgi:peroxiredoxin